MNANSPNIKPSGALPGIVCLDCILLRLQSAFCYRQIGWQMFKFSFRKIWECLVWDILGFSLAFFLVLTKCYGSQRAAWGRAWSPLGLNSNSLLLGWCSPQQGQLRGRVSLVKCGRHQCAAPTSTSSSVPVPYEICFPRRHRRKCQHSAAQRGTSLFAGFCGTGDSMRDMERTRSSWSWGLG